MSDTKINCDSFSGLDNEKKTLMVSCEANKRRKVSSPSLSVPPHVLDVSRLLQTLTLCPDSSETTVPINLTKKQWDQICSFLLKLKEEGEKMKHPYNRIRLMHLVRLLPLCSYLDLDEDTMSMIGLLIMRSLTHPVKLLEEDYEELITTIQQHLPLRYLLRHTNGESILLRDAGSLDYRVMMLLNSDWRPWICDVEHHYHTIDLQGLFGNAASVTLLSPFISMVKKYICKVLYVDIKPMRTLFYSDLVIDYCRTFIKGQETKDLESKINDRLENYRFQASEKVVFWEAVHQLSNEKKRMYDAHVSLVKKQLEMRDKLKVFLKKHGFTDKHEEEEEDEEEEEEDAFLKEFDVADDGMVTFSSDSMDCSIEFHGSVVPPNVRLYHVDLEPLDKLMEEVIKREWTGVRLRDDEPHDQFRTPLFPSLGALCDFLERTDFGIWDMMMLKRYPHRIYIEARDQVIPAGKELPWETRILDRHIQVKVHPDAGYIQPGSIARRFLSTIKKLAK
jgi:hypothetical protein